MSPSCTFSNPVDTFEPWASGRRSTSSTPSSTRTVRTITSSRTPSLASSTTSVHFSDDQRFAEDKLANVDIFACVDHGTPPMEATRKTLDVQTPRYSKKKTPLLKKNCLWIIEALRDRSFELRTFDNVSPEQFQHIVRKQNKSNRIYPKLYYDPDCLRITAMSPTAIHEHTIKFLANCVRELVAPYESRQMQISHLQNSEIVGEKDSQNVRLDMRLDLEPRYGKFGGPITTWVGESGYSGLLPEMERKLSQTVQNAPSINAAFIIALKDSKPSFPRQHRLLSEPPLSISDFTGPLNRPLTALTEVKVGDVVWCAIQLVEIFVFVRGSNGEFDFKVSEKNPLAARGVLHPKIEIENMAPLLNTASRQLFITIADLMEAHDDEDSANLRDAAQTARFPIDCNLFLEHIQGSLYQTAFLRYKKWYDKGGKDLSGDSAKRPNHRRK